MTLTQIILNIIRRCLYFVDLITFFILGQKFVKFFDAFLENLRLSKRHSEINWPLKDLYQIQGYQANTGVSDGSADHQADANVSEFVLVDNSKVITSDNKVNNKSDDGVSSSDTTTDTLEGKNEFWNLSSIIT